MSRLVFKLGASGIAILVIGVALALWIGARTDAYLLAFTLATRRESDPYVHVVSPGRNLMIRASDVPFSDAGFRVSPQGEYLFYRGYVGGDAYYTLVNLETWETTLLPEMLTTLTLAFVHWELEEHRLRLVFVNDEDTTTDYWYLLDSGEVLETEPVSTLPLMMRQSLMPGIIIAINEDGEATLGIILDENNLPRLFDFTADEPFPEFNRLAQIQPFSLSPDDQYFAAVLNLRGRDDLYLIPAWEGEPVNLTNNNADEGAPTWSPDARYIAYLSQRRNITDLHVVDIAHGETRTIYVDDEMIFRTPLVWIP